MLHTAAFYAEVLLLIPEFSYPSHPISRKATKDDKEMLENII